MKHILITTIAAALVVGCGPKAPDISIHDAAGEGNIEAVKQHLAAGTDVDVKDVGDGTPLFSAVYYGHKEIVELLLANGADVNAKDEDGDTPLDQTYKTHSLLRQYGGKTREELNAEAK